MCKIILKYGDLSAKEVNAHRENTEEGAGFAWYLDGAFYGSNAMKHSGAYNGYVANYKRPHHNRSPFTLFHSRFPSAGDVIRLNAQPFRTENMVFCHNGTIDKEQMSWVCISLGIPINGSESDSLLLFRILQKTSLTSSLAMLKMLDNNFVLVNNPTGTVHIIGNFDLEMNKSEKYLLSARNKYTGDTYDITTDLEGKILNMKVKKSPVYTKYRTSSPACSTPYFESEYGDADWPPVGPLAKKPKEQQTLVLRPDGNGYMSLEEYEKMCNDIQDATPKDFSVTDSVID